MKWIVGAFFALAIGIVTAVPQASATVATDAVPVGAKAFCCQGGQCGEGGFWECWLKPSCIGHGDCGAVAPMPDLEAPREPVQLTESEFKLIDGATEALRNGEQAAVPQLSESRTTQ